MDPILSVAHATVRFGGLTAVNDVSLTVAPGTVVGLIGPNGAGKTTLFNTISGLQKLTSGRVEFAGRDITRLSAARRARLGMGRTFQHLGLAATETIGQNALAICHLRCGYRTLDPVLRPWRANRAERRLRAGVYDGLAEMSLRDVDDAVVADLSFGVARRVECAAVIGQRPTLLLMDEPTTGLDRAECGLLRDAVLEYTSPSSATLIVAHDMTFVAEVCDLIYVLAEGRLIFTGRPSELRDDPTVVAHYLGGVPA